MISSRRMRCCRHAADLHDSADRTLQRIRNIPEGASTTAEDLALVAELLSAALQPGGAPVDDPTGS